MAVDKDYWKEYRIKNRDRINAYHRKWCEEHREQNLKNHSNWRKRNPDKVREQNKKYQEKLKARRLAEKNNG